MTISLAIEIGLQQMLYEVNESDGILTVCIQINSGELEREVVVNLTSMDDTATSTG